MDNDLNGGFPEALVERIVEEYQRTLEEGRFLGRDPHSEAVAYLAGRYGIGLRSLATFEKMIVAHL